MNIKRWLSSFFAIIILISLAIPAYAAVNLPKVNSEEQILRAEQTKWYYRVYNGKLQKRLWSITEEKWLTDWIDVT